MAWLDTVFTSYAAGCGDPNPPIGGFIEGFDSAVEGATIHYSCRPGLVPRAQMRAACANMSWSPDPATLECKEPSPGKVKTDCNAGKLWWLHILPINSENSLLTIACILSLNHSQASVTALVIYTESCGKLGNNVICINKLWGTKDSLADECQYNIEQ